MKCQRCDGLMVVDHYIDMQDDSGHLWLRALRCVICGEVLDPRIQRHRLIQSAQNANRERLRVVARKSRKAKETVRLTA